MSNIKFIKDIYAPKEAQEDLRLDGMYIHAKNMAATFFNNAGRHMTKKEVDIYMDFMYNRLMVESNLITEPEKTA